METIVPVYQLFAFFNCQTQENPFMVEIKKTGFELLEEAT